MKCRACGYVSFEPWESCGNCGAPAPAVASPLQPPLPLEPSPPPPKPQHPGTAPAAALRRRKARRPSSPKAASSRQTPPEVAPDEAPDALELSEKDLDLPAAPRNGAPAPRGAAPVPALPPAAVIDPTPYPLDGDGPELPPLDAAVIDRVEEVPEMFWAPGGAGLLRRAAALLVDLALLAFLLGLFLLGGAAALWREGIEAATLFSGPGLRAAIIPISLLAVLLSLVTHIPLHALAGGTPGKRLAGLEVRSGDGSSPTWTEAALRWLGSALVVLSGGVGAAWALFEPRRRGWADLISRTMVVARAPGRRAGDGPAPPRASISRGAVWFRSRT